MTTTLQDEIRRFMTDDGDDVAWTACEDCGRSVHEGYAAGHGGLCPKCHHRARLDDARSDLDEATSDLEGLMEELKDVRERIAEAKDAIKSARARIASLKS